MSLPVVFLASPRAKGNSDTAAQHFAEGARAAGAEPEVLALRDYKLLACTGCGVCAKGTGCAQDGKDDASRLHTKLLTAPWVAFAAPIYFYHLPAHFKAFIDRSQALWERRTAEDPALVNLPRRPAYALLVGARPRGEQLFTGSLLTLKYFLWTFNMTVADSRLYYGMDGRNDLAADAGACQTARAFGRELG